jgi:O-antigen/teichoic acid export membrane protein
VYSLVTGVLVLAISARLLGPEGRGQLAAITTWVSLFSTFCFLSLGQVALHRMAQDRQHSAFGGLLGSLLLLAVLLTCTGWIAAAAFYVARPDAAFKGLPPMLLVLGFTALPFMIWEHYGSSLLAGLDQLRVYNRYQIIGRTATVIAVVVLVGIFNLGVAGAIESTLLGNVIVACAGVGVLSKFVRAQGARVRARAAEVRALVIGGAKLHLNAIGTFLFTSANVLILNQYQDAQQVGYFQLANQLVSLMIIVPQAAGMVIYGKVVSLGPDGAWPEHRRLLWQTTALVVLLSAIAAALAPWAIPLVAGHAFEPAVRPFQWMLLGLVGLNFSVIMGPQWIGRGYFWQAAVLTFAVGCVNLGANFLLIPRYGMNGAVAAFVGTYFISVLGNGAMAWHCQSRSSIRVHAADAAAA